VDEQARCIVVCTDETGRFDGSVAAAFDRASAEKAKVILYDVTAPGSAFSEPRPNEWAGEGAKEEFDRPLDPVALERLGRHELAMQVQRAREQGIDAFGWLPEKAGADTLATYAAQQQADLVLIPRDLDDQDLALDGATGIQVERV
jgi:nucleotide-binding universal stress UspA family protein